MELLGRFLQASLELASPRLVRHAQLMALALFVGVLTASRSGRQGWIHGLIDGLWGSKKPREKTRERMEHGRSSDGQRLSADIR
ncbi:hypothetical protein B0J15DRAFT_505572 [Fusarium solani]|uniref:Uncharacterized protein n=1 Tax=Fusarium solani TaxID=169388 RepID=A0A9P9G690_FUSSL|nr:uncharacterized protein B0J15DRAFT_505572 [Fusarium solani]KAH7232089.1 hypothetical protein B0J15DRAFT_505572 [Fusarium solani]